MTAPAVAAALAAVLLAALAVLQVLVALGRPYGRLVWGGAHRVLPRRLRAASAVSVLLYAGMAAVLLGRAAVVGDGRSGAVVVAAWVLVGYLALGVVLNAVSRSRVERAVMTPACLVLLACAVVVARG
ncbi:hypothetical protein [Aquipuribacter hungaricus]|uniref:DUF3325 domain-containing protein n=1 Tax=Aquipuribacter hungaricus TaxID=545624 RepID=A0ABV7WI81_9MICO